MTPCKSNNRKWTKSGHYERWIYYGRLLVCQAMQNARRDMPSFGTNVLIPSSASFNHADWSTSSLRNAQFPLLYGVSSQKTINQLVFPVFLWAAEVKTRRQRKRDEPHSSVCRPTAPIEAGLRREPAHYSQWRHIVNNKLCKTVERHKLEIVGGGGGGGVSDNCRMTQQYPPGKRHTVSEHVNRW